MLELRTLELRESTPSQWLAAVLADFDSFLLDHAAAERKASAVALSLIAHYPDRKALVDAMMDLAREELEHFYQVYRHIDARGLTMGADTKDEYVGQMRKLIRNGRDDYFLDRLLISGIVEARGCERFGIIADALRDDTLGSFYRAITDSEARHGDVFTKLAQGYFDLQQVNARIDSLLDSEAGIVSTLKIRAALH